MTPFEFKSTLGGVGYPFLKNCIIVITTVSLRPKSTTFYSTTEAKLDTSSPVLAKANLFYSGLVQSTVVSVLRLFAVFCPHVDTGVISVLTVHLRIHTGWMCSLGQSFTKTRSLIDGPPCLTALIKTPADRWPHLVNTHRHTHTYRHMLKAST